MRRVAVVGSGISGLTVAHALSGLAQVTLFEAGDYFGGHTHTVEIEVKTPQGRIRHGVDTGFLVFNERTYPLLIQLFEQLQVQTAPSEMSFSVKVPDIDLEWSGSSLNTVFAQRRNVLRPAFWNMLREVLRFNRLCTQLALSLAPADMQQSIADFLREHRFSRPFRDWYFLPMVGSIWSCPTQQMLQFPMATMIRFCHNHGLLQVAHRPRWYTVAGGAKHYVDKMLQRIANARLHTPVRRITRAAPGATDAGVLVSTDQGSERFDDVVLACHSDQSLALLHEPSLTERKLLGAIRYHHNRAVLHTDTTVLPKRRQVWAAWNYERASRVNATPKPEQAAVCLHYWINKLQPLPFQNPVIVSLNPLREPRPASIQGVYDYAHPVFDAAAVAAQKHLQDIQGAGHVWFCGAWTRYGFHEDGLMSGLAVAQGLKTQWAQAEPGVQRPRA
jgi:uncharacterized protein